MSVRVCHVTSVHNSNDVRIFHKECASLAKAGYETYLVAKGESREEKGVHVVGVGDAPAGRVKRMTEFSKKVYLKALEINADIYHLHDPELLPYVMKLKKHGKKVIFDSHENTLEQIEDKTWIPSLIRKPASIAYKNYASRIFRQLDALVSVTPHIVRQLKTRNKNVWMVTNYPVLEMDMSEKKLDDFSLCFTGGIDDQWSHLEIVDLLSEIKEVKYVLCGTAQESFLQHLKQIDGWSKVDYKGKVPHAEAKRLQKKSHIGMALLKPTRNSNGKEGTIGNTKLFEYMMAGLPIICTDFILWKKIIDEHHCGICVDISNKEKIKDAIELLRDNPEMATQMGINGRHAVELEFNWETQEKILLDLYEKVSCP